MGLRSRRFRSNRETGAARRSVRRQLINETSNNLLGSDLFDAAMYLPSSRRRINCEDAIRVGADSVFPRKTFASHIEPSPTVVGTARRHRDCRASTFSGPVTAVEPATPAARRTRGHECHPHLFPDTPQRRPPCPSRSRCRTHRRYTRQPSRPIYRLIGISRVCRPEAERASRPAMWRRSVGLRMRFLLSSATVLGDLRTDPVRPQQVSCHSCDGGQRSPDGWVLPSAPPRRPQFRRTAAVRRGIRRGTFRWGNRWRPRRRTSRPTPTECECSCGPDAGARTSGASPFGALQRQRRPPCERRRPASEG